uniref:Protein FAR1-RELATED SEQUENCE n=1 Tax=Chenopodium quinoa TaxID=63459 RepID=A0A803N7A6_CHEQI
MELSDPGVDVAETEEKGTEIIELEAVETELIEDGLLSTPVRDVVNCIGDTTSTPLRCVMETDDGQYEDVLDHPEAERYCDAMENRVNAEKEADAISAIRVRQLITAFAYEKAFQKVYTDAKFEELKKELPTSKKRVYTVMFNSETTEASCECKLFECHGIMCRHQFKVYDVNNVTEVPSKYLVRRWRKDVHRRHTRVKVAYHDPTKTEEVKRYDKILTRFDSVCLKVATRPKFVRMAFDAISKLESCLDAAIEKAEKDQEQEKVTSGFASSPSVNNVCGDEFSNEGSNEVSPTISCGVGNSNLSVVGLEDIFVDLQVASVDKTPQTVLQTHHNVTQN